MKKQIYAISLLLSFMIVLSHELIVHHHHTDLVFDFSAKYEYDNEDDHHHDRENHNHHESKDEEKNSEHNHAFPLHHHISATNDFDIGRTNLLESNTQFREITSFIVANLFIFEFPKPPNLERKHYSEQQFLISSLCNPGTTVLRGPPAIV